MKTLSHSSFSISKKGKLFLPVAVLFLILSAAAVLRLYLVDRITFAQFTQMYCRQILSEDSLSLHYALSDPRSFGIAPSEITLGYFPSEDLQETAAALENQRQLLSSFSSAHLSREQALTLDILQWQNSRETILLQGQQFAHPLSANLGIQAQLLILFAEFDFRSQEDIDTYFLLLADTDRYFQDYLSWLHQNAKLGYAPSKPTVEKVIVQCREFLGTQNQKHFLQTVFENRCRACPFLTEEDVSKLSETHFSLLNDHVFKAYRELIEGLSALPQTSQSQGLAAYPGGRSYYETYVQYLCGTDMSLDDIRLRLYTQLLSDIDTAKEQDLTTLNQTTPYASMDAKQMLADLKAMTSDCFPGGPDIGWTVKEVEPELMTYASPAFYMVPPVDDVSHNTIYLNPRENLSGFSLYSTLAHEGFPGHLYQNTYYYAKQPSLIRRLLSFGGYTEGWATYTESLICEMKGKTWAGAKLYWLDRSLNLCIASLLDLGIHGDGWDLDRSSRFLADFGITDHTLVQDLYQYIVENPGNYLQYYLGALSFLDLRAECRKALGDDFSLTEFHQAVLDAGPCPFSLLRREVRRKLGLSES